MMGSSIGIGQYRLFKVVFAWYKLFLVVVFVFHGPVSVIFNGIGVSQPNGIGVSHPNGIGVSQRNGIGVSPKQTDFSQFDLILT